MAELTPPPVLRGKVGYRDTGIQGRAMSVLLMVWVNGHPQETVFFIIAPHPVSFFFLFIHRVAFDEEGKVMTE